MRLQVLPPIFRSIGIYVFASPPPLMLPLGALMLLTIVIAALARSSPMLALKERLVSSLDTVRESPYINFCVRCNMVRICGLAL